MSPQQAHGAVAVIDPNPDAAAALCAALDSSGLRAVRFADPKEFLDVWTTTRPTLAAIVCDLGPVRPIGQDPAGLDLMRAVQAAGCRCPIILVAERPDVALAARAMRLGAADLLQRPFTQNEALVVVRTAIARRVAGRIGPAWRTDRRCLEAVARMRALTDREREVLMMLAAGKSNKIVAHELGLSTRTVEIHRARMMERLQVRSLPEAVRLAVLAELAETG